MENFENEVMNETVETEEVINEEFDALVELENSDSEVSVETSEDDEKIGTGLVVGMIAGAGLAVYGGVKLVKDVAIPGCKKIKDNISFKLEEKKAAKEAKKAAKLAKNEVVDNVPEVVESETEIEEE